MTRRKKPRPLTGPNRKRWSVSVSRETWRAIQGVASRCGVTQTAVVEAACRGVGKHGVDCSCCDCVAERAF